MHFRAFMEFGDRSGVGMAQASQEGFRMVDAAEEMDLDGVVAELNAGGLIPEERVLRSLRIITEKVMAAFK